MADRISLDRRASAGDLILRYIRNAKQLPSIIARPAFISFRVTTLDTDAASLTDTERVNPDYDMIVERIAGYVQTLTAETIISSQHAFVNLRMAGQNYDLFDTPLCMVHLTDSHSNATGAAGGGGQIGGMRLGVPWLLSAGQEVTATFTAETGFGVTDKVAETVLIGTYVHKDLEIASFEGMSAEDIRNLIATVKNG